MNQYGENTLTEQLHAAIKSGNRRWNKDHVKNFFKSRIPGGIKHQAATDVLIRVGKLEGMTMVKINGNNHVYSEISGEAKSCLKSFLYGHKLEVAA